MGWTRKSYDALHDWIDASKREKIREILKADKLHLVVERLNAAKNLGEWHAITREAAEAVGPRVVESSAIKAQQEISMYARALGSIRTEKKARSSAENGAKGDPESHRRGGRPRKATK
jgi:hypothetical protein